MKILAIDPGQKGALAVVEPGPHLTEIHKMPDGIEAIRDLVRELVDKHDIRKCIIEQPLGAVGNKGMVGLATQHREWGILYAVCNECVSTSTVNPNTWIAHMKAATGRESKKRRVDQVERMCGARVYVYQCDAPLIGFWALLQIGKFRHG